MDMHHRRLTLAVSLSVIAAACGGGGGGGGSGGSGPAVAPSNLAYANGDELALAGSELDPIVPTFDGDVDAFTIAPALPSGVALDPVTGVVAGAALAPAPRRHYTITASNVAGSTSAQIALEIAAPQRFALVTSSTDDSLATLAVDTEAGCLLRGPLSFPGAADDGAETAIAHPAGGFVYVPHATTNTLVALRLDEANGVHERITSLPLGAGPHAGAFHPDGRWLVVTNEMANEVRVFSVDTSTGVPVQTAAITVGTQPKDLGFAPDGRQLFVAHAGIPMNGLGSSLAAYAFEPANGSLQPQSNPLMLNGARPFGLAVDPRGPFVYLALSMFDAVVTVRTTPAGGLFPIPALHPSGDGPVDVAVDPRGRALHVLASLDGEIRTYRIDRDDGALSALGTAPAGIDPRELRRDPVGDRVHVVAAGSSELISYTVGANGALARESSFALRPGSNGLAFATGAARLAFAPRFVHCANSGSDDVHAFRVDADTGALEFTGAAFTDDSPVGLAVDARTRFAVVAAAGARTLRSFTVDDEDGALTPAGASVALNGTPAYVAFEPSGRFVYVAARDVASAGDGWLLTYSFDAATGALALVDARAAGFGACFVAIEPTGEFVYVANRGNGTAGTASISAYRIHPVTGVPSTIGSAIAPGIAALAFHPDGRTVYAVLRGSDALARYTIDRASGALSAVPPVAGSGLEPAALAIDPRARFAWASYTGNAASGEIDVLPILAGGVLGDVQQQIVDGENPFAMSLDVSGRFLYAANQGSHDISVLEVGADTGLLSARTPMLAGTAPSAIVASGTIR